MKATIIFLLVAQVSWAGPFQQKGLFDFMLEDEASGIGPDDRFHEVPELEPMGPVCPFRCQCHLRVVQCSDLGLEAVPKDLPPDTALLDLQNNKITEIKDGDFKNLKNLHTLILINNKISKISPGAFAPLVKLERLYLSKNQLKELPEKMPKTLQELRVHENEITKVRKSVFNGLNQMIVVELGTNPLKSSGIENGAFQGMKKLSYIRIADTNITTIPQGLPPSLTELHLDGNKITKVDAASLKGLNNLANCKKRVLADPFSCLHEQSAPDSHVLLNVLAEKHRYAKLSHSFFCMLGLSFNSISAVDNGSLANTPHLRELHLNNNKLVKVPGGLADHKYIQVVYLHNNNISVIGSNDFCPPGYNTKKASYSGVSLFSNPVQYWEIQPSTFRCVYVRAAVQLGNYK